VSAYLPDITVHSPATLAAALEIVDRDRAARPLAGGTDLMVLLHSGALRAPATFVSLHAVRELAGPIQVDGGARLPALATFTDARSTPALARRWPMLAIAAREVGVLAIQARATWAGNIANASPAADGVPALMAYGAEVELASRGGGSRRRPLAGFYTGYKTMDRRPDELITAIHLPPPPPRRHEYYRKVGTRRYQAISKVLLAGWVELAQGKVVSDVSLVYASVAPFTLKAAATEAVLRGQVLTRERIRQACSAAEAEVRPIDDIRSTAAYRRRVAAALLADFLDRLL
jgi:CO/xanthine dehydrogenase FAD-binding subunit